MFASGDLLILFFWKKNFCPNEKEMKKFFFFQKTKSEK